MNVFIIGRTEALPIALCGVCKFHRSFERLRLQVLIRTVPSRSHTIVCIAANHVIGHEGHSVESLPPATFTIFSTRLLIHDFESDASILAEIFLRTSHREHTLEILDDVLVSVALRTKISSHFLVLGKLFLGDTECFLDNVSVKLSAMAHLHNLARLAVERESQRVVANNANRSEANIDRPTIFMWIGEEQVRIDLVAFEKFEGIFYFAKAQTS